MGNEIPPDAPIAWLCSSEGWTECGRYEDETRLIPMETPDGADVAVLFIGRDENNLNNWTYGIPIEKMATADYVVLFTLREDVGMLKLPVAMLHEMQKQSQTNRDDGRWCVAVDWLPESNGFCATLAPIHAPHLKANVYDHLVPGPETSLSDWYHTAHRS